MLPKSFPSWSDRDEQGHASLSAATATGGRRPESQPADRAGRARPTEVTAPTAPAVLFSPGTEGVRARGHVCGCEMCVNTCNYV